MTSFVTAFFIPFLEILMIPMSCSKFSSYFDNDRAVCTTTGRYLIGSLSALTLVSFIPGCIVAASAFFDGDPRSTSPFAKASGRIDLLDVMARAIAVFLVTMVVERSAVVAVITFFGMYVLLTAYSTVTLPFFRQSTSKLVSCLRWEG